MFSKNAFISLGLAAVLLFSVGCGKKKQAAAPKDVPVKTMQVIKRDTPIIHEYTGFIEAEHDVELKAKVSGVVVKKLVKGGEEVKEGQLLFQIDPRNYKNALLKAEANLISAQANLANVRKDVGRYEYLYEKGAISRQLLDANTSQLYQAEANVNAMAALVESARVDLSECDIKAPFSGKLSADVVAEGTQVSMLATVLGSVSNNNPMRVKFSLSEKDYLDLMRSAKAAGNEAISNLEIVLADGKKYPQKGVVTHVDREIGSTTGTMVIKATFDNSQNILLPGMFAHIYATADTVKDARLIPQRAVKEMLYKKFVYVVGADNKVEMKEINLGPRSGRLWVVEGGLDGSETIVVEGVQKLVKGSTVKPTPMTEADLDAAVAK